MIRLYPGKVFRIRSVNCIEVDLDLGFGVSLRKPIVLEGVERGDVPSYFVRRAKHCLIVLLGGKRVYVYLDSDHNEGHAFGRVFLDQPVHGDPVGLMKPDGLDRPLLEISTFYTWLRSTDYDIEAVKEVLNGKKNGGS